MTRLLPAVAVLCALFGNNLLVMAENERPNFATTDGPCTAMAKMAKYKQQQGQGNRRTKRAVAEILAAGAVNIAGKIIAGLFEDDDDDEEVDLTPILNEMNAQRQRIDAVQSSIGQIYDENGKILATETRQAAKLVWLNGRLDYLNKQVVKNAANVMKRVDLTQEAFVEFGRMTEARIDELTQQYQLIDLTTNQLQARISSKMAELDGGLTILKDQLVDYRQTLEVKIGQIEGMLEKVNSRLSDMTTVLGGIHQSVTQVENVHRIQTDQLALVAAKLGTLDQKVNNLTSNLEAINSIVQRDLNSSAMALSRNVKDTFANIERRIEDIVGAQEMQQLVIQYSTAVDRLHFLMHYRDSKLTFNRRKRRWMPAKLALKWSRMVIEPNRPSDQISEILDQLHRLANGDYSDLSSSHASIYDVYKRGIRRYIEEENRRAAFSFEKRQQLEQVQAVRQSEMFYLETMFEEMQSIQSAGFLVEIQAHEIRFWNDFDAKHKSNTTTDDSSDESDDSSAELDPEGGEKDKSDSNSSSSEKEKEKEEEDEQESYSKRRYRRGTSDESDESDELTEGNEANEATAMLEEQGNKTIQLCDRFLAKLQQQRNIFVRRIDPTASPKFRKEPFFYMYDDATSNRSLVYGFTWTQEVPPEKRKIRQSHVVAPGERRISSKKQGQHYVKRDYAISGCRLCLNCTPRSGDKVMVQCSFRNISNTNFLGQQASTKEVKYPITDSEILDAERKMASLLHQAKAVGTNGSDKDDYEETFVVPEIVRGKIAVVAGVLSVNNRSRETVCGILVGQPPHFDVNLAGHGISAISIEVCERSTGKFIGRKELPKWFSNEFKRSYSIVSTTKIFTSEVKPNPQGWITGIGFSTTGLNGDTLTLELHTQLF